MYTLKIKWVRHQDGELVDETTLFIPADEVKAHSEIAFDNEMSKWEDGTYFDYRNVQDLSSDSPGTRSSGRLICVERDNRPGRWYIASQAWILGPDGKTIERLS